MKKFLSITAALLALPFICGAQSYVPAEENLKARAEFAGDKFGIFLHWGIYSMFGQGEWYLNREGVLHSEYSKAASGFYPAGFDAAAWVSAIKASGAKDICFTTRHHDGFSMFHTAQSPYNIVDATPFGRDVLKELADECHKQGIRLHLYYSHLDWGRDDYPQGRTGLTTGRDASKADWDSYYNFMNAQLTELLTGYGEIGSIWFDGHWDHDQDAVPFDWRLEEQYRLIHSLQPACLVANNHHITPYEGEDFQIFERDLPGENKAGLSGQDVSALPLETCETMNGMWGYKVVDQNYKSVPEIVRLLVGAAGKGANLLLNIGPQPDGRLPQTALDRLAGVGKWIDKYGDTIYGTTAGDVPEQPWGVTTRKGDRLFVHVFDAKVKEVFLPLDCKVKSAVDFSTGSKVQFDSCRHGLHVEVPASDETDRVIELRVG